MGPPLKPVYSCQWVQAGVVGPTGLLRAGLLRNPQDAVLEAILRSTSCSSDEISKLPPGMEASHLSLPTLVTCVHWTLQESIDCPEEPSAPQMAVHHLLVCCWNGRGHPVRKCWLLAYSLTIQTTKMHFPGCLPQPTAPLPSLPMHLKAAYFKS